MLQCTHCTDTPHPGDGEDTREDIERGSWFSFLSFKSRGGQQFATILVDFYIQLRTILEQINLDSFQRFRLRAGLNQAYLSSVHVWSLSWPGLIFATLLHFFPSRYLRKSMQIGPRGGGSGGSPKAPIWHLGQHGQRRLQNGINRRVG